MLFTSARGMFLKIPTRATVRLSTEKLRVRLGSTSDTKRILHGLLTVHHWYLFGKQELQTMKTFQN